MDNNLRMDNLRTVKKTDLTFFVKAVLESHNVGSAVTFGVNSFYFDFYVTVPDDTNVQNCISDAMHKLYDRGILMEIPVGDFGIYEKNVKHHLTFIHPFNVVE